MTSACDRSKRSDTLGVRASSVRTDRSPVAASSGAEYVFAGLMGVRCGAAVAALASKGRLAHPASRAVRKQKRDDVLMGDTKQATCQIAPYRGGRLGALPEQGSVRCS